MTLELGDIIPTTLALVSIVSTLGGFIYVVKRFNRDVAKDQKEEFKAELLEMQEQKNKLILWETTYSEKQKSHELCLNEIPLMKEKMASWEDKVLEIHDIKHDLDILCGRFDMFWEMITPALNKALHAPIHLERDALMEKLEAHKLTKKEVTRLEQLLKEDMRIAEEENDRLGFFYMAMTMARLKDMKLTGAK